MKNTIKKAVATFGVESQLNVAVEELSELIKEICKYKRYQNNIQNIVEEIADCYIMIEQLVIIFGIGQADIEKELTKKLNRLEERIKEKERCR